MTIPVSRTFAMFFSFVSHLAETEQKRSRTGRERVVEYHGIVNSSYRMVDAEYIDFSHRGTILTLFGRLVVKSETKESTWRETLPVRRSGRTARNGLHESFSCR